MARQRKEICDASNRVSVSREKNLGELMSKDARTREQISKDASRQALDNG